jgi:hypothetical protein
VKNHFARRPLERFELHSQALESNSQTLEAKNPSQRYPRRQGRLAAGDVVLAQVNMWHGGTIELTLSRLAVVAWPEVSPASGGGGTVVARPRALDLRRGQGWSWSTCGTGGFSVT